MDEPREVEVKLDLPRSAADALARKGAKALGAAGTGKRERLTSVYFDTPERNLHKRGLTLRVRTTDKGVVQTVKAQGGARSGLFDRSEWETAIDGPTPDRHAWLRTPAKDVLPKHPVLRPVFETIVDRTTWIVAAGRSRIEIALDRGRVVAGAETREFAEIELELKDGEPADLFELARRLGASQPVKLGVVSKSERGYDLTNGTAASAYKAEPVEIAPDATAAAAFRAIAHSCLRQFRRNEVLLVEQRSAEALHEARVGMRRLRSALSLFRDLVADDVLPRLKDELRAASRALGDARNIDVYLERFVLPEQARDAAEPGVTVFVDRMKTRREQSYDKAIETLDGPAFRRLMVDLLAWIEVGPWAVSDDPMRKAARERPVAELAAEILDTRFRQVRKKGRDLDKLDPVARHRVRIAAKKLRYAAEFFAAVVDGKAERRRFHAFIKSMKAFQQLLGDLNDLHTGHDLAADLARQAEFADIDEAQVLFAAGHLSGTQDERASLLLAEAAGVHRKFARQPKFWRDWRG